MALRQSVRPPAPVAARFRCLSTLSRARHPSHRLVVFLVNLAIKPFFTVHVRVRAGQAKLGCERAAPALSLTP